MRKLSSKLYDLGFILCFLASTIYHYFEYFTHPRTSLSIIAILFLFLNLLSQAKHSTTKVHPKKLLFEIKKINILFILSLIFLLIIHILEWPTGANHSNFNTFLITILLSIYSINYLTTKKTELNLSRNRIFILGSLIPVYFLAALHKLNYDFFNSAKSCANWYHIKLLNRFFLFFQIEDIPSFIKRITPNFVIAIEVLGPILLFFNKTRKYGLYFLIALHSYLAIGGFTDFSSLALAILILYFPSVQTDLKGWFHGCIKYFSLSLILIPMTLISHIYLYQLRSQFQTLQGFIFLWSLYMFFKTSYNLKSPKFFSSYKYHTSDSILIFQIILIILFGFLPYMGYRSAGTFTMFSNLRIVGSENNHLFMKKLNLFKNDIEMFKVVSVSPQDFLLEDRQYLDSISKSAIDFSYHRFKDLSPEKDFKLEIINSNNSSVLLNKKNIITFLDSPKSWFFYKTYMYNYLPEQKNLRSCRW